MSKVENTSYHQFMVRKLHAIKKRKEKKAIARFEANLPKLLAVWPKGKFVNLGELQSVYRT